MPQTILAILAMMIATLFAFYQHQNVLQLHMKQIQNEVSIIGTGVAEDLLGEVGRMGFDREVERLSEGEQLHSPNELTQQPFGQRVPPRGLEDFHGVERTEVRTIQINPEKEHPDTLRFQTRIEIDYVDENDLETEVTGPTKAKKVTVLVSSLDIEQPQPIRLSRSYTCGSPCDW